jgi:hypothetical protein
LTQMVAQISRQACPLMRPKVRAYSHQGHGPRADQTGRIHISDFRYPANSFLQTAAGPYMGSEADVFGDLKSRLLCPSNRTLKMDFQISQK